MSVPKSKTLLFIITAAVLLSVSILVGHRAAAHPVSQGEMDIQIHAGHIALHARITLEEVLVPNAMDKSSTSKTLREACQKHGEYLLKHLYLKADGKPLSGKMLKFAEPPASGAQNDFVQYDFEFPFANADAKPHEVAISQDVLNEFQFAPGNQWEANYTVKISVDGGNSREGILLTRTQPMIFACDWPAAPPAERTEYLAYGVVILFAAGLFYLIATMKRT